MSELVIVTMKTSDFDLNFSIIIFSKMLSFVTSYGLFNSRNVATNYGWKDI